MEIANHGKNYSAKGNCIYSCQYLVVFCTKYRRTFIEGDIRESLMNMLYSKQGEIGYSIISVEIMPDHVQMIINTSPQQSVCKTLNRIKNHTANKLRKNHPALKSRLPCVWTRNNFISTVGTESMKAVMEYLYDQKGQ